MSEYTLKPCPYSDLESDFATNVRDRDQSPISLWRTRTQIGPSMIVVPNHRERQFMQHLRGRGWIKAIELPDAIKTLGRLLEKGWIEKRGTGRSLFYRIYEEVHSGSLVHWRE